MSYKKTFENLLPKMDIQNQLQKIIENKIPKNSMILIKRSKKNTAKNYNDLLSCTYKNEFKKINQFF